MKRRLLSLFVAFAMTISMVVVGAGAVEPTYGDTAGHWAENAIDRWSGHGVVQGSNGEFDPNGQLTCAQLATILAKLLKLPAATDAGFNDVAAGAWYADAINRCAAAGILNGNGDGTVDPNGAISRERAMVMLGRALGIKPIENPDLTKFSDAAKVASYAQGMVAALIEKGVVGGVTSDTLAPQDDINRASTVTILDRAIGAYADKTGGVIKVEGTGIVIVVADDVTITGDVEQVIVPADNVGVTIRGCENIDSITVTGENSKVILDNSSASDVTLNSKNTEIETKGNSKVDTVNVPEDAAGATVNAGSGTTIGSVENKAENTTVTGNGSVKEVASDKDMTVETKNTEVKNTGDEKISVTDKNGKTTETTAGGSSTTTGGSGSSSGGSSHSHSYNIFETDWDTMATVSKCSCGATQDVENSSTYYVSNDTQLKAFRNMVNSGDTFEGKTVKLTADINLNNEAWTPIGNAAGKEFAGTFDGQGHKITGLTAASDATTFGLFGKLKGTVVIKNFELNVFAESDTATATKGWAGVVGQSNGATCNLTLEGITVKGTLKAADKVAGLIAQAPTYNKNGSKLTVRNCVNEAAVTGTRAAGICCSINAYGGNVFESCVNKGTITATEGQYRTAAGILCKNEAGTTFTNCRNEGVLNANIAYSIATKLFIQFGSGHRAGSVYAVGSDTYYYTQTNPNLPVMYDLFVGNPYSAHTAVDWKQVVRTSNANDIIGMGAGIWYDTEHKDDYKVSAEYTDSNMEVYEFYKVPRYFKSINDAFDHNLSNSKVTLSADQTLTETKESQMTYTIDLGGHTLTANSTIHKGINAGKVTIKDGAISRTDTNNDKLFEITEHGILELKGVTLNSTGKCIALIAATYTGTIVYDENSVISGYIDLGTNSSTKVKIGDTTYVGTNGRYVVIDTSNTGSLISQVGSLPTT